MLLIMTGLGVLPQFPERVLLVRGLFVAAFAAASFELVGEPMLGGE